MLKSYLYDDREEGFQRLITPITHGLWRHYKGGLYRVLGRGRHHATGMWLVLYMDIGTGHCYTREEYMWEEMVGALGTPSRVPRFVWVS